MAEYPEINLNSQLIAAGLNPSNPTDTYVDFANQLAKTQQEQALQEQAIARAKELTKQAQFETKYQAPESMTPEEAESYLKIVAQAKGLEIDQASIDEWVKTLPEHVNRQVVESFANRFARESTRSGQPAMFQKADKIAIPTGSTAKDLGLDEDESDPSIGHVPEDGMYQVVYDNQGTIKKFIPGGKEAVDQSSKLTAKMAESTEKQWQKLDGVVNGAFKTRSGGLGSLSTAIFRSVRAINTIIANDNMTAQDLANISQDIAGVFQGGAPTVVGTKDNDYRTAFTDFEDTFRKYTGVTGVLRKTFGGDPLSDTKDKLLTVLVDLRDSAISNLKSFVESEEPAYKEIIDQNPQRWADFQDKKLKFIESGVLIPPGANTKLNISGIKQAQEQKPPKGEKKASGMNLPSADEIDAELERRKGKK